MTARSNVEIKSVLPPFGLVQRFHLYYADPEEEHPTLELKCPRCEHTFIVREDWFVAPLHSAIKPGMIIRGRTCPYCMRCCEIPEEVKPAPKKVRIVKRVAKRK